MPALHAGQPGQQDLGVVRRIVEIADSIGARRLADHARRFIAGIEAELVYVAVVGQMKRGKSSLINALVGQEILPTGVLPVTEAPTVLKFGTRTQARVIYHDRPVEEIPLDSIADYVTEAKNPGNRRGVDAVEVFVASRLLSGHLCLIDTPGLGSIVDRDGAVTGALVPRVDAVLLVAGVDPPLSGDERDLVGHLGSGIEDLIVVIGKADLFARRDLAAATDYAKRALEDTLPGRSLDVLQVSTREPLLSKQGSTDWYRLVDRLSNLGMGKRRSVIRTSVARGTKQLVNDCLDELTEVSRATYAPVVELEARLERLKSATASTAFDWLSIYHAAERETQRVRESVRSRRASFLAEVRPRAGNEVRDGVLSSGIRHRRSLRSFAWRLANNVAERELTDWIGAESRLVLLTEADIRARLLVLANRALGTLSDLTALAPILRTAIDRDASEQPAGRTVSPPGGMFPGFVAQTLTDRRRFLHHVFERMLPHRGFARIVSEDACRAVEIALITGSARIELEVVRRVSAIGTEIESDLQHTISDALDRADRAAALARASRQESAE